MSQHIEHIEITNFKSIRHATIKGCKRINVFIGYPNVGKSAILEAMAMLSYLRKKYDVPFSRLCRMKFPGELFFDGNIKKDITISYRNDVKIKLHHILENESILTVFSGANFVNNRNLIDTQYLYKRISISSSNQTNVEDVSNAISDIISVKKYSFQNEFYKQKTSGLALFSPSGENLVDVIQANKELRKEIGQLFKASGLKLNIDQSNNSIKGFKQLDDDLVYTIPFYQMADTLQRLIFHKAAIMSNENSVLLFEEPEAHMFPPYISNLTGDIIDDKNNNQFFIATHSPFVLNDLIEDAKKELSIYAVGLQNGETTIKRISDEDVMEIYQYGIDLFFNLEDYLKDDQGDHS